ncbi:dihydrofolate reductase family protein [Algoriphagus sp. C2-6-M1]|uniref:dihydrofolate reductase family protein n=1 Tax=Algoriphagus persicinus TaxID=3108754 RepID=UPI002B3959D2|nr:dihydrofolate reductase family protein [Algoriphagus sp. C2-6-M1]MEB2779014.1 dihydrofolate reductase family protein [Algoriphagus sp. C2-6-M1]
MKKVIYYVASSLDGFIAGENDDISKFIPRGDAVEKYLADLQDFETVIMGRKTYEFGYQFGLKPGQPAYPNMDHYIFSKTLRIDQLADRVHIEEKSIKRVKEIIEKSRSNVYLCGGGQFAGWLLDNGLIDQLKLKLNPIILGGGIPLFGDSKSSLSGELVEKESFDGGLQILTYDLKKEQ